MLSAKVEKDGKPKYITVTSIHPNTSSCPTTAPSACPPPIPHCPPPVTDCPRISCPKVKCPKIECPKIECPKIEFPNIEFPKIPCPPTFCTAQCREGCGSYVACDTTERESNTVTFTDAHGVTRVLCSEGSERTAKVMTRKDSKGMAHTFCTESETKSRRAACDKDKKSGAVCLEASQEPSKTDAVHGTGAGEAGKKPY